MKIRLEPVTSKNLRESLKLSVTGEQKFFVADNAVSIAQSKFYPTFSTDAVYAGEKMVGFVMYGLDPDEDRYTLVRLMIDHRYQRQGYGRSATEAVLERLKNTDGCDAVYLSFVPKNTGAALLYENIGFARTGEIDEESGEIIMRYEFENRES